VDCDGDGRVDVPAGAPLVCTVNRNRIEANLTKTMTALLLAVRKDGVATLHPVRTDGMRVTVPPGIHVNVRDNHTGVNALNMSADLMCSEAQAGKRHTLVMAAEVSGIEAARTPFDVTCGAIPIVAGIAPVAPFVAAAPAAAAHAPVPVTEPGLSASSSVSHAASPAGAPGVAQSEVAGPAVAVAPDERQPEPASNVMRMIGAGVLFAGFGVLEVRRRSRRALAKVRR
jgi:hypothetical protein